MVDKNKTQTITFKSFLQERRKSKSEKKETKIDWEIRKEKWLNSITTLYEMIDTIIVKSFKELDFEVVTKKEMVRIFEEYIGYYEVENYIIKADNVTIKFFPVGTVVVNAFGRVNMVFPNETIKLVLHNWNEWKIMSGFGNSMQLVEFNEENIVQLFKENI
jgi:hypothetical protein